MTLTAADFEALEKLMYRGITPEEHDEHHAAIRKYIARENRRNDQIERVKTHVFGWGIVTLISGSVYGIGALVRTYFSDHFK